jgi:hypothetical protein
MKAEVERFYELDITTRKMVGDILDRINGINQQLAKSTKAVSDLVIDQSLETRTVIIDALSRIVHSKGGQGDTIKSLGLVEVSSKTVADAVLGHLVFAGMHDRHEEVAEAFGETFGWAYQDPNPARPWSNFTTWLRENNGVYWINGKAGSGKSTLMRFLFDNPRTREELQVWGGNTSIAIAGFFFWNSGITEQRRVGGLRSLLFQILRERQHLIQRALPELWDLEMSKILRPSDKASSAPPWSFLRLKKAFANLALQDGAPLRLCLFIDGLDEYEGEFTDIARFCHNLAALPQIKICVSSRPLVEFCNAFETLPGLKLHHLTFGDISIYVKGMLEGNVRMLQLAQSEPQQAPQLITEIVEAASGVFLWVKLAVQSLLQGLRNRDRISDLQRRLRLLPRDLDEFYRSMLGRIPPFYLEHASKLLQIVRASQSIGNVPLTTSALYFADEEDPNIAIKAPIKRLTDTEVETICEDMDVRLKANCGGLLEISTDSDHLHSDHDLVTPALIISKRKVLYLHRTVKDFLEEPETWDEILSHTCQKPFNPNVALLRSFIMRLKTEIMSHGSTNTSFDDVWEVVESALAFARQAEIDTGQPHTACLRELQRAARHHWNMTIALPRRSGNWVTFVWDRLNSGPDSQNGCLSESCHCLICQGGSSAHDFISFAIAYGMPLYVVDEITQNPDSVSEKSGRPWLDYALSQVQLNSRHVSKAPRRSHQPSQPPNLMLLWALLQYGGDPNLVFQQKSPWQIALSQVAADVNANDLDLWTSWARTLKLLFDYRAGAGKLFTPIYLSKDKSALAIVTRVFIEGASKVGLEVPPEAAELHRLLAQKQLGYKMNLFTFWKRAMK